MGVSRRVFLARSALAGLAFSLPGILDAKGLLATAQAQSADLVTDTFNGLVAFVVPGNDDYSVHQGEATNAPGGIAAGGTQALMSGLDKYVPASVFGAAGLSLPASGAVAALLNDYALQVNPLAMGPFPSQFARLAFAQKAEVFRRFESDPAYENTEMRFVGGILPGFTTFVSMSEAGVLDANRKLKSRPVGWQLTNYAGLREGRPEFRGYYGGRRSATTNHGNKKRRKRHGRRR